jgi:hypothetical protein
MPSRPCLVVLSALALAAWSLSPARSEAQVRRCTAADGSALFTDRRCSDLDATERAPRPPAPVNAPANAGVRPLGGGCARNLQDLEFALRAALEARDVNRLAGLYHWAGVSSTRANDLMARLDVIASRPLVDVLPVAAHTDDAPEAQADAPPRRAPIIAFRIEQTLANGSTPTRTVFALQRHLGCWWIRL